MSQPADLAEAVDRALRAPSVHNTQPRLWRIGPGVVELHAVWTRPLPATDPDRRDVLLSCGAALHHLQVALAARGMAAHVDLLPDPENLGHLATVVVQPGVGDAHVAALVSSIDRRRTDRRRMSHRAVPSGHLNILQEQASRVGVVVVPVTGPALRERLAAAMAHAADTQVGTPGYPAELQLWTHRHAGGHDGISIDSLPPPPVGLINPSLLRDFPSGRLAQPSRARPGRRCR